MRNAITIIAGTSLLAFEKRVLNAAGTLATGTPQARGVLEFKVDSGEQATLTYEGRVEAQAGGAIGALARVKVAANGFIVAANSGDVSVGFCENTAVTSGSFGDFVLDFTNATMTTSEG